MGKNMKVEFVSEAEKPDNIADTEETPKEIIPEKGQKKCNRCGEMFPESKVLKIRFDECCPNCMAPLHWKR